MRVKTMRRLIVVVSLLLTVLIGWLVFRAVVWLAFSGGGSFGRSLAPTPTDKPWVAEIPVAPPAQAFEPTETGAPGDDGLPGVPVEETPEELAEEGALYVAH